MDDKQDKPRKGCIARFFGTIFRTVKWTLILGFLAGVGYVVWVHYEGRNAIKRIETTLATHGVTEPVSTEVPAGENASAYWLTAMETAVDPSRVFIDSFENWPEFGTRISQADSQKLGELLVLNQTSFDLVQQAMTYDQNALDLDVVDDFEMFTPIYSKNRKLMRSLEAKLYYAISINDQAMALDACVEMAAAVDAFKDVNLLISELVRLSLTASVYSAIEHTISCMSLSVAQLRRIENMVEHGCEIQILDAYEGEMWFIYRCALDPYKSLAFERDWRSEMHINLKLTKDQPFYRWQGMTIGKPVGYPRQEWWDQLAQYAYYAVEDLTIGRKQIEAWADVQNALAAYQLLNNRDVTWKHFQGLEEKNELNYLNCKMYFQTLLRKQVVQTALQIEKFRVQYGRWPVSMDEATKQVPYDVFGQPIKLSVIDGVLRVYSIGLDGVDDQGLGRLESVLEYEHQDDIAFRLLDPKQRNQKPKPKPVPVDPESTAPNLFE